MFKNPGASSATAFFGAGVLACLAMPLGVGYTMAIPSPAAYFQFFREAGSVELGSLLWDAVVVFGPTLAIPLLVMGVLLTRFLHVRRYFESVALALGALVSLYFITPALYGDVNIRPLPWWASAAELVILIVAAVVAIQASMARRKQTVR